MKKRYINAIIFIIIIILTSFGSLYIGQSFLQKEHADHNSDSVNWHAILHHKLAITKEQDTKLTEIEEIYMKKRKSLEEQMRKANMELSRAISQDKYFSPNVQNATDKIHHAMGALQKITLEHLFDMKPILTKEQNLKLEQMITDALAPKR